MKANKPTLDRQHMSERLRKLGLLGLAESLDGFASLEPLAAMLTIEENDRHRRSYERRLRNARIGAFKGISEFDWKWPAHIDRVAIDELFTLNFITEGSNVVFAAANGLGKTTLLRNLAHQAVTQGVNVRSVSASEMLADLAAQDSPSALRRRLQRYVAPKLLCIDEVGYLAYNTRYADLFFEVVSHRYEQKRSIALTTNKAFAEWSEVFPHAACVVTLVDRLTHRAEVLRIEGKSYRLKDAEDIAEARKARRKLKSK
jgi:DNA replication protein DnaC